MAVMRPAAAFFSAPFFAAVAAVILGTAGLVGGALPQSNSARVAKPAGPGIVVGGAYVRQPASPVVAAAYFTIYNTGDKPDVLVSVTTGAGQEASLHTDVGGAMQLNAAGLTIPAHGSVTLSPSKGHLMIQKLYGTLLPGQTVNLDFSFATAGEILVTAPVIAIAAPAPSIAVPQ